MNIDALSIEVSTSAKKAAQEFEALAASMRRANAAAGRAQGMESMRRAVDGMRDALGAAGKLEGVSSFSAFSKATGAAFRQAEALQRQLRGLSDKMRLGLDTGNRIQHFQASIEKTAESAQRLKEQMRALSGMKYAVPEYEGLRAAAQKQEQALFNLYGKRDVLEELGTGKGSTAWRALAIHIRDAEEALNRYERAMQGMENAGGAFSSAAESPQYERLSRYLSSAAEALERYRNEAESARPATKSLTGAAGRAADAWSGLGRRMGRMLQYRALRGILSGVTSSLRQGLQSLYQYSQAAGGGFSRAIDSASASLQSLKGSLAAAVAPAIAGVIPLLNSVASAAAAAAASIANFFSILGLHAGAGEGYHWEVNAEAVKKYGQAAGGAAKANKDLLASFDQLHVIQSESGGGGGGGGAGLIFDKVPNKELSGTLQWVADHFQTLLDLAKGIGAAIAAWKIGSKLINAVNSLKGAFQRFKGLWNGWNPQEKTPDIQGAGNAAKSTFESMKNAGESIDGMKEALEGLNGAKDAFSGATDMLGELAKKARGVAGAAALALPLLGRLVSKLFGGEKKQSQSQGSGVRQEMEKTTGAADEMKTALDGLDFEGVENRLSRLRSLISALGREALSWLRAILGAVERLQKAAEAFSAQIAAQAAAQYAALQGLLSGVLDVSSGVMQAVTSAAATALGQVETAANGALTALQDVLSAIDRVNGTTVTLQYKTIISDGGTGDTASDYGGGSGKFGGYIDESNLKARPESEKPKIVENFVDSMFSSWRKRFSFKAEGGFARVGEMFIAREAGPELVGSIGNKTAVANNDQIVQSVAGGVAQSNRALERKMDELIRIEQALLNKESTVKISPSAALGRVNAKSAALYGKLAGE